MNRIGQLSSLVFLLAATAAAQDTPSQRIKLVISEAQDRLKEAKVMALSGAVMGPAVKNAPYSAVEVTENTQTLGDGNRIHNSTQTTVYRDSEGRVRRETSGEVTIWDPVAGVSYLLNPKTQTARKMTLALTLVQRMSGGDGPSAGFFTRTERGIVSSAGRPEFFDLVAPPPPPPPPGAAGVATFQMAGGGLHIAVARPETMPFKSDSLGSQMIEGVMAEGTRVTSTIEAGAIGNDMPIQIVSETWYSQELQTMVKNVHSDPRTGEETFQLTHISRVEPPSTLFQVPAEYQLIDPK